MFLLAAQLTVCMVYVEVMINLTSKQLPDDQTSEIHNINDKDKL